MRRLTAFYVVVSLLTIICSMVSGASLSKASGVNKLEPVFQKGMSYRPAPYPNYYPYDTDESDESLRRMAECGVEWVAIITWWFQENLTSTQIYPHPDYTPTNESLKHAVQNAHELGMKVMLKPMVDTEDARNLPRWMIPPSTGWFTSYKTFVGSYAQFAQETGVELLCIGCEFKTTEVDVASWRQIISEVRKHYSGPLTYAATVDSYQHIAWWDALDYVGINAFFPLTDKGDLTLEELKQAWNRTANDIESWHSSMDKPILFTEIGYRSGNGTNKEPWNWTKTMKPDPQEQFDCYLAAFQILWNKQWFYALYWWIWEGYPNMTLQGYDKAYDWALSDFTPQNKPVQYLIKSWYSSERQPDFEAQVKELKLLLNQSQTEYNTLLTSHSTLLAEHNALLTENDNLLAEHNTLLAEYTNLKNLFFAVVATLFLALAITVYVVTNRKRHQNIRRQRLTINKETLL